MTLLRWQHGGVLQTPYENSYAPGLADRKDDGGFYYFRPQIN